MATRLTDGSRTIEITMSVWTGNGYTPDWSHDFFEVGCLDRDEEKDAYIVQDVGYCIDQAEDWRLSRGDYSDDEPNENNCVDVFEEA